MAALAVGAVRAEATAPTPYDRVARALAADGWTPRTPVVLLGSFFSFRSPLEWYLPERPRLTLGLAAPDASCPRVLVVAQGPRNRARLEASGLLGERRTVGGVLVGVLKARSLPELRGASSLAAAGGCVRLVPEARLVATLHRLAARA